MMMMMMMISQFVMHMASDIHAVSVDLSASCFVSLSVFCHYRSHAVSVSLLSYSGLEYHNALFPPRPSPLPISLPFSFSAYFLFAAIYNALLPFASVLYVAHPSLDNAHTCIYSAIVLQAAPLSWPAVIEAWLPSNELLMRLWSCTRASFSGVIRCSLLLVPRQTILKWKRRKRERREGGKRRER